MKVFETSFEKAKEFWQNADTGLFTSFEWVFLWQKHVKEGRAKILALKLEGKVVALLPLAFVERKMLVSKSLVLELLGQQYSYHLGIVFKKGLSQRTKQDCAKAFAKHLFENVNWSCLDFRHLKDDSFLPKALESESVKRKWLSFKKTEFEPCLVLRIPESREQYFSSLEKGMRKKFRRDLRRIEKDFQVETLFDESVEKNWLAFLKLHSENMKRKGQETVLGKKAFQNFFRAVSKARNAVFVKLMLDGKLAGVLLGLVENRVFYFVNVGYASNLERYSLGNVMVLKSIECCFENNCLFFDMLAGGDAYKKHFGTKEYDRVQVTVASKSKFVERDLKKRLKKLVSGGKSG